MARGVRLAAVLTLAALATSACRGGATTSSPRPGPPSPGASGGADAGATTRGDVLRIDTDGGTVTLRVRVAETPEARQRGLMGVRGLAADAGMVFLFEAPTSGGFWMKNTLIPLSIAFWDEHGRIVAIREMVPCRADPCPIYRVADPYVGAVEANRGYFARHGVEVGDRVRLVRARTG